MFYLSKHIFKMVENEKIIVENINKINSFSEELISFDNFNVYGLNLKIISIEEQVIIIEGKVSKVEIL